VSDVELILGPDGNARMWLFRKFPIQCASGEVLIGCMGFDVTEEHADRDRMEEARWAVERVSILEHALDGIAFVDTNLEYVYLNEKFAELIGLPTSKILGTQFGVRVCEDDQPVLRGAISAMKEHRKSHTELRVYGPRGLQHQWVTLVRVDGHDGDFRGFYCFIRDITLQRQFEEELADSLNRLQEARIELEERGRKLEEMNRRLQVLATTDGLTETFNHREFNERLATEVAETVRYGSPLSMLMLDIDDFKAYNDAFGHPAGDAVLKQFAQIVQQAIRRTDMLARYGGEEFTVLLPHTGKQGASEMAERIRDAVEVAPWEQRAITVSIGSATFGPGLQSAEKLLSAADTALYGAKRSGKNRVVVA
jgi:diguanylate cyclase (GGDEF)-like protein/PAS domain S-box-containing protein